MDVEKKAEVQSPKKIEKKEDIAALLQKKRIKFLLDKADTLYIQNKLIQPKDENAYNDGFHSPHPASSPPSP